MTTLARFASSSDSNQLRSSTRPQPAAPPIQAALSSRISMKEPALLLARQPFPTRTLTTLSSLRGGLA
jgi:hypothetical protein